MDADRTDTNPGRSGPSPLFGGRARPQGSPGRAILDSGEDGAAYSIGLLATFPAVILLIGFCVELIFILEARAALLHAARVVARSALVWEPEGPDILARKGHQAAAMALTPIASGADRHRPARVSTETNRDARGLARTIGRSAPSGYRPTAIEAKYVQAREGSAVDVRVEDVGGRRMIRARVGYDYPFTLGFLGRCFGRPARPGSGGYVRRIEAEFSRPAQEAAPDGLDIDFHPTP